MALTVKCNGVIKIAFLLKVVCAFFIIFFFSLVNLTSAWKGLVLFLDYNVMRF